MNGRVILSQESFLNDPYLIIGSGFGWGVGGGLFARTAEVDDDPPPPFFLGFVELV